MTSLVFAFAGIDGSGKSELIRRVSARLLEVLPSHRPIALANRIYDARTAVEVAIGGPRAQSAPDLLESTWDALSCAIDFSRHLVEIVDPLRRSAEPLILLSDRFLDCYAVYGAAVDPPCGDLIDALLDPFMPAEASFFLDVSADVAWERIARREGGPGPRETTWILARMYAAYRRRFEGREDVTALRNEGSLDELAAGVAERIRGIVERHERDPQALEKARLDLLAARLETGPEYRRMFASNADFVLEHAGFAIEPGRRETLLRILGGVLEPRPYVAGWAPSRLRAGRAADTYETITKEK